MNYAYNITTDISSAKLDIDRLSSEIASSSISTVLTRIDVTGNDLTIIYPSEISVEDKSSLDAIVLSHSGEAMPEKTTPTLDVDSEGRQVSRLAFSNKGWHYQAHSLEFSSSTLNSIYNKDKDDNDLGYGEIKLYKSDGDEIVNQTEADSHCVKSVVTWKPDFDFEIISGNVRQESKESFDMYLHVGIQVSTGYPSPNDWFYVPFTNGGINMKYIGADEPLKTDGRTSKYVKASTNGDYFEITLNHGAGNRHSMSIIFEIYKSPI